MRIVLRPVDRISISPNLDLKERTIATWNGNSCTVYNFEQGFPCVLGSPTYFARYTSRVCIIYIKKACDSKYKAIDLILEKQMSFGNSKDTCKSTVLGQIWWGNIR